MRVSVRDEIDRYWDKVLFQMGNPFAEQMMAGHMYEEYLRIGRLIADRDALWFWEDSYAA